MARGPAGSARLHCVLPHRVGVEPVADPHKPGGAALGPLDSHNQGDRSPQKENLWKHPSRDFICENAFSPPPGCVPSPRVSVSIRGTNTEHKASGMHGRAYGVRTTAAAGR